MLNVQGTPAAPLEWSSDGTPNRIGPFTITGVLGKGGMGVVFDAVNERGHRVALKVIRPEGDPDNAALLVARFLRESKILQQLNHPSVVRLVDSGDVDGVLYLAMERIEGVSLLTIRRRGALGFDPLVQLGIQLADALAHMHEAGVIHRDIKPANVLIDAHGLPVITDFGISGMDDATGITRMGDLLGSPGFMAPEVTEGAPASELSDQFALGRLLYELGAAGPAKRLPRNAPLLKILAESLEIDWNRFPKGEPWRGLEGVLQRMLATLPDQRFPDARGVRAALQAMTSSDLLDLETLSERIESYGLIPRTSYEEPNQNLPWYIDTTTAAEHPSEDGTVRHPAVSIDEDPPAALARARAREAGLRRRGDIADDLDEDATVLPPPQSPSRAGSNSRGAPIPRAGSNATPPRPVANDLRQMPPMVLPNALPAELTPAVSTPEAPPRSPSGPAQVIAPPQSRPPSDLGAARGEAPKIEAAHLGSGEERERTLPQPAASADVARSSPLSAAPVALPSSKELGLPPGGREERRPSVSGSLVARDLPVPDPSEPWAGLPPSSASAPERDRVVALERQVGRLKEQLANARRDGLGPRVAAVTWAAGAAVFSLAIGLGLGRFLVDEPPARPLTLVLVPPNTPSTQPRMAPSPHRAPSPETTRAATELLTEGLDRLRGGDLPAAEILLARCIESADLPDCHRALGTIFALRGHPAARSHLLRYLELVPEGPDASSIRGLLEGP